MDTTRKPELLIVTGMSGAGRSTVGNALEDQGWYVIEQDVAITGEMPGIGEGPISGMKQSVDYLHNVVAPALAKIGK